MQIFGKEIKDECSKCGEVLQCELFLKGHGIKRDRENVTEMVSCQMEHQKSRLDKEPKEDLPVKEKCELPPEIMRIIPYHNVEWVKFIKPLLLTNIWCCVGIGYVAEKSRHQECM
jgi:hypothetical protein|uniref:Uncharacterized protein n=1 Tax=virus sp. ctFlR8 TaxID=2825811 RepID=A0A8S5RMY6_9VIRU|nr:MAG TPA: hypothetical protein [virus sp. ctFlR8]